MENSDEKIAELSVIVDGLNKELPRIRDSISDIYKVLSMQEIKNSITDKEIDKLPDYFTKLGETQILLKQISDDTKKNISEIEQLKQFYHDIIINPPCKTSECSDTQQQTSAGWSIKDFIMTAPSVIAILSFIGYIIYSLFVAKMSGKI